VTEAVNGVDTSQLPDWAAGAAQFPRMAESVLVSAAGGTVMPRVARGRWRGPSGPAGAGDQRSATGARHGAARLLTRPPAPEVKPIGSHRKARQEMTHAPNPAARTGQKPNPGRLPFRPDTGKRLVLLQTQAAVDQIAPGYFMGEENKEFADRTI
jgi:hypothetical protein